MLAQLDKFAQSALQVVINEVVEEMNRHLAARIREARASLESGLKEVQQEMLASEGIA